MEHVRERIISLIRKPLFGFIPDAIYLKLYYRIVMGKHLHLKEPSSFNEIMNWRKLYDRDPRYTSMVDKYRLKLLVQERCGEGYTIPLIDVWDRPDQISLEKLPEKFVLKANHAGGVIICRNKEQFDLETAQQELRSIQKKDYYLPCREWPYKNVERKILCEQYMGENLIDYKNYCINGKVAYTFVWVNEPRNDGRKPQAYFCGAYNRNWERTDLEIDYPTSDKVVEKPECYEKMVQVAEKMSAGIPFVRVDCYVISKHPYVGEMTFFPWGGFQKFKKEAWNQKLGEMVKHGK